MDETKQTRLGGKVRHVTHIARATGSNLATGDVFGSVPAQFAHRPEKAGPGVFIGESCLKSQFPFGSRDARLENVFQVITSFRTEDALAGFIDEYGDAVLPFPKAKKAGVLNSSVRISPGSSATWKTVVTTSGAVALRDSAEGTLAL